MAFKYTPANTIPYYPGKPRGRKPPFGPTGKGLAVDHPFRATNLTRNASLTSHVLGPDGSTYLTTFYLFVEHVSTAWNLSGETAQSSQSRAFYPRNLSQDDVLIQGICPSQAEYDRLVEFVLAHHLNITETGDNPTMDDSPNQTRSISFMMAQPIQKARTYRAVPNIFWDVAITHIEAGHERFKFQPTFQLTCKVLWDRLQSNDAEFDILNNLNRDTQVREAGPDIPIFGLLANPLPAGTIDLKTLGKLPASTQEHISFSAGGGGGSGGGSNPLEPGDIDAAEAKWKGFKAAAAALAPSGFNQEALAAMRAKWGSACWPTDPSKCYFFKDANEGDSIVYRNPGTGNATVNDWRSKV